MEDKLAFVQTLANALANQLASNGLTAQVSCEPVPGTRMYRFCVVSDGFAEMMNSERQSLVWRIAESGSFADRCAQNQHASEAHS